MLSLILSGGPTSYLLVKRRYFASGSLIDSFVLVNYRKPELEYWGSVTPVAARYSTRLSACGFVKRRGESSDPVM